MRGGGAFTCSIRDPLLCLQGGLGTTDSKRHA